MAVPSASSRGGIAIDFGEAEIEQLGLAALGDENIRGLDIAVNDAFGVRGFERVGDLDAEIEKLLGLERAAFDAMLERFAFEQLHGDERLAIVLANFVNRADVRMIQAGGGARFALESLEGLLILGHCLRQKFQRHQPPQFRVFGLDRPHPSRRRRAFR